MTTKQDGFTHFNVATMSGVFPGTRTKVFQRLRLLPLADADAHQPRDPSASAPTQWAQLLWYEQPTVCRLYLIEDAAGRPASNGPLLQIDDVDLLHGDLSSGRAVNADFGHRLQAALAAVGWQPHMCGSCHFWRPLAAETVDGVTLGVCDWHSAPLDDNLSDDKHGVIESSKQSSLGLGCTHWRLSEPKPFTVRALVEAAPKPASVQTSTETPKPDADVRDIWGRLKKWFRHTDTRHAKSGSQQPLTFSEIVRERSGVGAGTEPCFACQGRIANLGALVVETPAADTQTFSLWRCRQCRTYYLNSWIDRWVRLDNLETEEHYYRIAPDEAATLFVIINSVQGGEHPGQRSERTESREQMNHFLAGRQPLSHQIKQGR